MQLAAQDAPLIGAHSGILGLDSKLTCRTNGGTRCLSASLSSAHLLAHFSAHTANHPKIQPLFTKGTTIFKNILQNWPAETLANAGPFQWNSFVRHTNLPSWAPFGRLFPRIGPQERPFGPPRDQPRGIMRDPAGYGLRIIRRAHPRRAQRASRRVAQASLFFIAHQSILFTGQSNSAGICGGFGAAQF